MSIILMALLLTSSTTPVASDGFTPAKEKIICITDTETGTLISKKICHTASQWKALHDGNQGSVDTFRNRSMQGFCPANAPNCSH